MRFKGLDLNLLVAFDVLIEERSVSRGARRLNLSQPATSAVLARLRDFFQDDILVLNKRRMHPTPFALGILPQVRACLESAEILVGASDNFDPQTSERTFRVLASDYMMAAVLVPLSQRLAIEAPGLNFELIISDEDAVQELGRGEVDLIITPDEFMTGTQITEFLFEERYVVAGCRDNPFFKRTITKEAIFERRHVAVALGARRTPAFADKHLHQLGIHRNVAVTVSSFTMVPWALIGTNRLAVMHERLAVFMAHHVPIIHAPLPFDFPVMRELMEYHPLRRNDDGLRWLRDQLRKEGGGSKS